MAAKNDWGWSIRLEEWRDMLDTRLDKYKVKKQDQAGSYPETA